MSRCGGIVAEFAECGKGGELINFRGGNVASQCHSLASVTRVLVYPSKPFTQLKPPLPIYRRTNAHFQTQDICFL